MISGSFRKVTTAFLLSTTLLAGAPAFAGMSDDVEALRAEVQQVENEIATMDNPSSLFGLLKQSRLETARLTLALLENQQLAEEGAGTLEFVVPSVQPNAEQAAKLHEQIIKQTKVVEDVQAEVDQYTGGLIQAVALSRLETEKLTLAQLNAAWMQASYGIALPGVGDSVTAHADDNDPPSEDETVAVAWADPNYPEIDYDKPIFRQLEREDFEIVGWWGLSEYKAEVDDSPAVFAINVNGFTEGYGDNPSLKISCREGTASVVFDTDDYLLTDYDSNSISVTQRIDEAKAQTKGWSKVTTNEGAGLFGKQGEDFMRDLYGAKKAFFRLSERDGETHSLSLDMAGVDKVIDAAAAACGFSTLELSSSEYKAIQTMLNAGGFDAGTPDGKWGPGSKDALKAFQAANNLPETGAPDSETLKIMGLEL